MFHVAGKPSRDLVWGNQKHSRTAKATDGLFSGCFFCVVLFNFMIIPEPNEGSRQEWRRPLSSTQRNVVSHSICKQQSILTVLMGYYRVTLFVSFRYRGSKQKCRNNTFYGEGNGLICQAFLLYLYTCVVYSHMPSVTPNSNARQIIQCCWFSDAKPMSSLFCLRRNSRARG